MGRALCIPLSWLSSRPAIGYHHSRAMFQLASFSVPKTPQLLCLFVVMTTGVTAACRYLMIQQTCNCEVKTQTSS